MLLTKKFGYIKKYRSRDIKKDLPHFVTLYFPQALIMDGP